MNAQRQPEQLHTQINEKNEIIYAYGSKGTAPNLFSYISDANFTHLQFTRDGFNSFETGLELLAANFAYVVKCSWLHKNLRWRLFFATSSFQEF